jgi:hypothetical protein
MLDTGGFKPSTRVVKNSANRIAREDAAIACNGRENQILSFALCTCLSRGSMTTKNKPSVAPASAVKAAVMLRS